MRDGRWVKPSPGEVALGVSPARPELRELGDSGTPRSGGTITGYERNSRLRGVRRWADQADEMLAVDPKLAEFEDTLRRTLLSAEWVFEPGPAGRGKGRRAKKAQKLAEQWNRDWGLDGGSRATMVDPWESQLSRSLRFVPVGFRYLEEVYGYRDGRVVLLKYADREPSAHGYWVFDERGQELLGVEQIPPTPYLPWAVPTMPIPTGQFGPGGITTGYFIPASKLLLLTFGRTGQNFEGRGALRPCWQWYSYKQHAIDLLAIAAERWAVPTPHVEVNRQEAIDAGYTRDEVDTAVRDAQRSAQRYMSGEEAWLSSIAGVNFKVFGGGAFDPSGHIETINHANQEMASAWGLAFLEMGLGEVGSRALGQLLQEQSILAAVNILDTVAEAVNGPARPGGGTVARICGWNDSDIQPDELPVLTHHGLRVDALGQLLPHLPNLVNTGVITPTDELEDAVLRLGALRHRADLPREPEARLAGRVLSPPEVANFTTHGHREKPLPAPQAGEPERPEAASAPPAGEAPAGEGEED